MVKSCKHFSQELLHRVYYLWLKSFSIFHRVKGPIASTYSVHVEMSLLTSGCVQPCVYNLIARLVIDCVGLNITPIYTLG